MRIEDYRGAKGYKYAYHFDYARFRKMTFKKEG